MSSETRLAVVTTHPVQYQAPLFTELAARDDITLRVFYTWSQSESGSYFDAGFGTAVEWDIPLLDGYEYEFVPNTSPRPGLNSFGGIRNPALLRQLALFKPDVLLVYGWNHESHLGVMRRSHGRLPVLFRGDSTLLDPAPGWRRIARRVALRCVYRHVDGAIAVGKNSRDYFRWSGVPATRIWVAPHSVDDRRFAEREDEHKTRADEWRTALGIPQNARVVLFAGKLQAKKDPLILLRSFPRDVDAHLVFVGSGELEQSLRAEAEGRANVHFMPFQNQQAMPAVYRLGDVFVLPSCGPGETWGLALNEAMTCGLPVISSDRAGAARDLVLEGQTGWIFRATIGTDLERVLRAALNLTAQELGAMARRSRDHVQAWTNKIAAEGIATAATAAVRHWRDRHGSRTSDDPWRMRRSSESQ